MEVIKIKLRGNAPMLMHSDRTANPLDPFAKQLKAVTSKRKKTDDDHAEISRIEFIASLYYDESEGYHMPAQNLEACLLNSAKQFKLGTTIKQALLIHENGTFTFPDDSKKPEKLQKESQYVDMRTVKVQQSKNVRTRPIFHEWEVEFEAFLDTDKLNTEEFKKIVLNAGDYVGLGDYRPRYGRFEVVAFNAKKS